MVGPRDTQMPLWAGRESIFGNMHPSITGCAPPRNSIASDPTWRTIQSPPASPRDPRIGPGPAPPRSPPALLKFVTEALVAQPLLAVLFSPATSSYPLKLTKIRPTN